MRLFLKTIGGFVLLLILVIAGLALSLRANPPESTFDVQARTDSQAADDGSSILIFGATRNTGLLAARNLVGRGDRVTAFVRPTSDRTQLERLGAGIVVGDALDIDSVREAMEDGSYRAVITTIGCFKCDPPPDHAGNANIFQAAREAGINRIVLVTTIGAGDSADALPALSAFFLGETLPLKTRAEEELRASGLDYTIIRPGGLRSGRRTGNGILSEDRDAFGFIFREDLAELLVAVLDDDRTIGRTLAAVDANRSWPWADE